MKTLEIHRLTSEKRDKEAFKICTVQFDEPCEVEEKIQTTKYNIVWVKKGYGKYLIDFQTHEISDQMIFFLTPGQMYQVLSEKIVEGVRISFEQDFYCIDTFGSQASCNGVLFKNSYQQPFIKLSSTDAEKLENITRLINYEFENPGIAHREMIHTYLQLLMIRATRMKMSEGESEENFSKDDSPHFMSTFNALLEAHYKEKHAVSDYAEAMHISPKALHKKIKTITGKSVSKIIQNRIILEAKRNLYHTNDTVKEIGFGLGFDDSGYFTRFFTKYANESPTEFREKMKVF
ncbi:MAG: AraC family transcriptional regulator [Balneola sp.]